MVVLLHIHELPVAACHRRMRNLADRARESVFIPLVHEDDGRERRVDDVHRGAPPLLAALHIHEFGHKRQLFWFKPGRVRHHRARVRHLLGDACARPAFALDVRLQVFRLAAHRTAPLLQRVRQRVDLLAPLIVCVPDLHGLLGERLPCARRPRHRASGLGELRHEAFDARSHALALALGVAQLFLQPLQAVAAVAVLLFADRLEFGVEPVHIALRGCDLGLVFGDPTLIRGCDARDAFVHARAEPRVTRLGAALAPGVHGAQGLHALAFIDVADVLVRHAFEQVHPVQVALDRGEVLAELRVVADERAAAVERGRLVEHALAEDVVELAWRVGRLHAVQQAACGFGQSEPAPHVFVEQVRLPVDGGGAVDAFEQRHREHVVAVVIHEARVDRVAAHKEELVDVLAPAAGGQRHELRDRQRAAAGRVLIPVHDGAPHRIGLAVVGHAAQEHRLVMAVVVADAALATQIRVIAAVGTAGVRGLVECCARGVQQRDLRVDECGFARFALPGEQGDGAVEHRGGVEGVVAAVRPPVDELAFLQHPVRRVEFDLPVEAFCHARVHHSSSCFTSCASSSGVVAGSFWSVGVDPGSSAAAIQSTMRCVLSTTGTKVVMR